MSSKLTVVALACLALGACQPPPPAVVVLVPAPPPGSAIPAQQDNAVLQKQIGPNAHMYVPVQIKSDQPGIEHGWALEGKPGNGIQQSQPGQACATDADCVAPYGCFPRADSGRVPLMQCARAPGQ